MGIDATVVDLKATDSITPVVKKIEQTLLEFAKEATKVFDTGFNVEEATGTKEAVEATAVAMKEVFDITKATKDITSDMRKLVEDTAQADKDLLESVDAIAASYGIVVEETEEVLAAIQGASFAQSNFNSIINETLKEYENLNAASGEVGEKGEESMLSFVGATKTAHAAIKGIDSVHTAFTKGAFKDVNNLNGAYKVLDSTVLHLLGNIRIFGWRIGVNMVRQLKGLAKLATGWGTIIAVIGAAGVAWGKSDAGADRWLDDTTKLSEAWGRVWKGIKDGFAWLGTGVGEVMLGIFKALAAVLNTIADVMDLIGKAMQGITEELTRNILPGFEAWYDIGKEQRAAGADGEGMNVTKDITDTTGGKYGPGGKYSQMRPLTAEEQMEQNATQVGGGRVTTSASNEFGVIGQTGLPALNTGPINFGQALAGGNDPRSGQPQTTNDKGTKIVDSIFGFIGDLKEGGVNGIVKAVRDTSRDAGEFLGGGLQGATLATGNIAAAGVGVGVGAFAGPGEDFASTSVGAKGLFQSIQNSAASSKKDAVAENTKKTAKATEDTVEAIVELPGKIADSILDFVGLGK